PVSVPYSSAQS
nr:Chain I, Gtab1tide [synthetic construct]4AY5_J Chain J, Gtab1tide [synthetic construct]4AY5_K Chain K, Gtab1tide [synthetic construct]4AY5_L Chain L, Gtab1tide [synthetic construct]